MPIRDLTNKVAVVTGAASGIGLALARALHSKGARLALLDIDERVREVSVQLSSSSAHICDVSQKEEVFRVAEEVKATHGAVHLLINNAGVSLAGPFEEASLEDFEWVMSVNFWGAVYGCRAFLPSLKNSPEAQIVNVCSSFAWLGFAGKSAYSSSKAALKAFSESLRAELSTTHIGVSLLFPGPVDTSILRTGKAVSEAQREGEIKFLASRAVSPKLVTRRTLRGIAKNSARIVVSVDYWALDKLVRLSPALTQSITTKAARAMPF